MTNDTLWQTKVAARLHDPAEKALVLLRDPAGHENGTSLALTRLLGFTDYDPDQADPDNDEALVRSVFKNSIPKDMYQRVQRADWWAAAADRPQFPMDEITVTLQKGSHKGEQKTFGVSQWAQVQWTKETQLIHPLTGDRLDLKSLQDSGLIEIDCIKETSFNHLLRLLIEKDGSSKDDYDWRKTLLSLWRFGPEINADDDNTAQAWGALWSQLPADTRIPDHSIWDHLDLTNAFAGAFTADPNGEIALLTLSIGPVQPFIAAARKMEDLWAGSHLLARLSWEAMRVVCEELGPDSILFPRLRGVPQVDLWLRDTMKLPDELFAHCDWQRSKTDANPLFSAALPNRFVALVPASRAKELAEKVQTQVRAWLQDLGNTVVGDLLQEAGFGSEPADEPVPFEQMKQQLEGFPEVHWAAVPFSLIETDADSKVTNTVQLSESMRPFFADTDGKDLGFLDSDAWKLLKDGIEANWDGSQFTFFKPNPGVLYPAVHDLAERALAAAKTTRAFTQLAQHGYRDSLTGETEWLTTNRSQLKNSPRQQTDTLWARIAKTRRAWAKKGEHLGALSAIKRLWPNEFAFEVAKALSTNKEGLEPKRNTTPRFVVSTHTMSLAHQLDQFMRNAKTPEQTQAFNTLKNALDQQQDAVKRAALPRKLASRLHFKDPDDVLARIPTWLDACNERDESGERQGNIEEARQQLKQLFGKTPETYYALIKMDGDKMGAWLAGGDDYAITYEESFHPHVKVGFEKRAVKNEQLAKYGQQKRALSPNRHLAISGALNDFSLYVVRHIVEQEFLGRLIYAGGDDVFAMLPVADVLPAIARLRHAYSGTLPDNDSMDWGTLKTSNRQLHCKNGFAYLDDRHGQNPKLMRMMGSKATASCGVVIAHHQAPLTAVRRELDAAEHRAKTEGGRNAFSITVVKRSGGALRYTDQWESTASDKQKSPINLLCALRDFLVQDDVSRRAVFATLEWLDAKQLPLGALNQGGMAEQLLNYQLWRQAGNHKQHEAAAKQLAADLIKLVPKWQATAKANDQPALTHEKLIDRLRNFLQVAEFLARETRATTQASTEARILAPESNEEDNV